MKTKGNGSSATIETVFAGDFKWMKETKGTNVFHNEDFGSVYVPKDVLEAKAGDVITLTTSR